MFCVIHFIYHFLSLLHTLNKKEFFSCPIFLTTDAGVIVRLVLHAVVIVTAEMIDGIIAGMIGVTTAGTTDTITGLGDNIDWSCFGSSFAYSWHHLREIKQTYLHWRNIFPLHSDVIQNLSPTIYLTNFLILYHPVYQIFPFLRVFLSLPIKPMRALLHVNPKTAHTTTGTLCLSGI